MISARPIAISRSRVQTRISWRKEWSEDGSEGAFEGDAGAADAGAALVGEFLSSVLCIFSLPRIYNTGVAHGARISSAATAIAQRLWRPAGVEANRAPPAR